LSPVKNTGADGNVFYNHKFFSSINNLRGLLELECKSLNFKVFREVAFRSFHSISVSNHKKTSALSAGHLLLPQMNGSLKEEILQRISTKTMNDEYLCLAPNISYEQVTT
jgi:hypothetical protein